ncbi:MAG: META domain-containing protein [Gammaproteobacteria bacterium]|jgi:heat shock protein HslJ|nr:META domain-containing protein [Gammaproteobacteria bacterium]MDH3748970.1 META domain-containing protein [Gammaproteobacteria bacterium]MDH3805499.1 META domain-containing protein [Gammaproteobacteria bacterium]
MKAMLGFGFFLLFLGGFAFVMLQGRQLGQQNMAGGGAGITAISWRPAFIGAEPVPEDSGMFVLFEVDGSIKGHGGCNSFFGSLEKSDSGIAVGPLGATRMSCEERVMSRETAFMDALQKTRSFEAGAKRLQLLDDEKTLLAELVSRGD